MTFNALEHPKGVFSEFFTIFGCSTHFNTDEMAGDRPRQPAYEIPGTKLSPTPLVQGGRCWRAWKTSTLPKSSCFTTVGWCSVKTVAGRYRHAAYHNKHWWQVFRFINIDDLERPQKGVFSEFFCNFWIQRTFQHWIATKWLEINQDNLRMKFSALNVNFSSRCKSRPPRFKEAGHKHAAYHNKQ